MKEDVRRKANGLRVTLLMVPGALAALGAAAAWGHEAGPGEHAADSALECLKPDDSSVPTSGSARIEIRDASVGAWMVLNNTFLTHPLGENPCDDPDEKKHRAYDSAEHSKVTHGFLLQLGNHEGTGDVLPISIAIEGRFDDGSATERKVYCVNDLACEEEGKEAERILWFDIVPRGVCPESYMKRDPHLPYLYYESREDEKDVCETIVCDSSGCDSTCMGDKKSPPGYCLRRNSLHGKMKPRGVLTYWSGKDGFNMKMRGKDFPGYYFKSGSAVDVHLYPVDPKSEPIIVRKVKTISILADEGGTHGGYHDPPMLRP